MVHDNNAAGRLYTTLDAMRKHRGDTAKAKDVWPRVLRDLEVIEEQHKRGEDLPAWELLRRLAPVMGLPSAVRTQLAYVLPDEVEDFTQHLGLADQALSSALNMEIQWKEITRHLQQALFTELFHCDRELSKGGLEPGADKQDIRELHQSVLQLVAEVEEAAIPPELKAYLLKYLALLDDSLRQFVTSGMEGVRNAAYAAAGAWLVEQPDDRQSEPSRTIVRKYSGILAKIFYLTGIAENIASMLTGGLPVVPIEMISGFVPQLEAGDIEASDEGTSGDE